MIEVRGKLYDSSERSQICAAAGRISLSNTQSHEECEVKVRARGALLGREKVLGMWTASSRR